MPTTIDTVEQLVGQLSQYRLLEPAQANELAQRLKGGHSDPRQLAQTLLQKGWLTPYQINQLFQGHGADLVLGQYIVLDRLGEGATGQVFKARHQRLKRVAALKVIRRELLAEQEAVQRFYREIQVFGHLSHAHFVEAYDAGPVAQTHFFAMEYIEGIDLERLVKQKGPLPVEVACEFIRQAALGLQHAHERGLVHRDIKPSNLIVARKTARERGLGTVKILDMGLVQLCRHRAVSGRTVNTLTENGTLIGTPDYMSPEQIENPHLVDIRADIYSLGCTLYYLLSGRVCYPNCTLFQKLLKIQQQEPTPVEQVRSGLPPSLAKLVRQMIAKKPQQRPQTPADVAAGLAAFVGKGGTNGVARSPRETMDGSFQAGTLVHQALGQSITRPVALKKSTRIAQGICRTALGFLWGGLRSIWNRLSIRWRWRLAGGGAVLMLLVCGGLLGPFFWSSSGSPISEDAAESALKPLVTLASTPGSDAEQLRQKLVAFRVTYPGTVAAQQAAAMLMRLPSPLDKLDEQTIPKDERLPWQPKELVAILGSHQQAAPLAQRMAFAAPCHLVVGLSRENVLNVWNLTTGEIRTTITLKGAVPGFVIAPFGQRLATIQVDRTLRVWDVATGQPGALLQGHGSALSAAAFDDRCVLLATGALDKTIKLWDVNNGNLKATLEGHQRSIRGLAFGPDGQTLVSASEDGVVKLWDVAGGRERVSFVHGSTPLRQLAFSPDGKSVVSVSSADPAVKVWDAATGNERFTLAGHHVVPHNIAFSADGRTLATASPDPMLKLWDMSTGQERATVASPPSTIVFMAFTADSRALMTWGQDQILRQWDPSTGKSRGLLSGPTAWLRSVAFAPDGQTLATGSLGGTVKVWDAATAKVRSTLTGHTQAISGVAYAPDGQTLASVSQDQTARLFDLPGGQLRSTLQGHSGPILALGFAPDALALATASADGTVKVWDTTAAREKSTLRGHTGWVQSVAFAPDGQTVVSGGDDGTIRLWKRSSAKELTKATDQHGAVRALAVAPQGKCLATADDAFRVALWNLAPTQLRSSTTLTGHSSLIGALAFTPDGKRLAAAGEDGRVILWSWEDGKKQQEWKLSGAVVGLAFAVDGRHLAIVNDNGTVYILRLQPAGTN